MLHIGLINMIIGQMIRNWSLKQCKNHGKYLNPNITLQILLDITERKRKP